MRRLIVAIAFTLLGAATAYPKTWRVIDGDTIELGGEAIRIANIDTPEIKHAQCDAERRLGRVAKAELDRILARGTIALTRGDPSSGRKKDKYGRTLGVVSVDGTDVGEEMVARDLARPWSGKRRSWCNKEE
ncbi:thermonuclease family protein [Shinella sp.]|uniref:thermonuclease family protein n=1 Tax=Shinella sp. TaxID=1870904 RepID=UPI003F7301CE